MFAVAAALLLTGAIGGTRAALTMNSQNYVAEIQTKNIGIQLVENGDPVENGGELLTPIDDFKVGVKYDDTLAVANAGDIDEYVRVVIYRYWQDAQGNKVNTMDPGLIQLNLCEDTGWILDEDAVSNTPERMILYYNKPLAPEDETGLIFDSITVAESIKDNVIYVYTEDDEGGKIVTVVYPYNGYSFVIEAQADGVQTHNAEAAILSAWGREVSMSGTTISGLK